MSRRTRRRSRALRVIPASSGTKSKGSDVGARLEREPDPQQQRPCRAYQRNQSLYGRPGVIQTGGPRASRRRDVLFGSHRVLKSNIPRQVTVQTAQVHVYYFFVVTIVFVSSTQFQAPELRQN